MSFLKISILLGLLFFVVEQAISQPIMIHPDTIDFGCIDQYSEPDREFYIYNQGDTPLQIITIMGASGALVPTWPMNPINPGDSAIFKLTYDTQRLGVFNKSIKIKTNEDTTRTIRAIGEVKMSTSTEDIEYLDSLVISVFNDYIHLNNLNDRYKSDFECVILNMNGTLFKREKTSIPSTISLSDLPNGIYVLSIRNKSSNKYKAIRFFK